MGGSMAARAGAMREQTPARGKRGVSRWEHAVAAAGAAMVAAIVGYLLWYASSHAVTPPQLVVTVQSVVPAPGSYTVTFRVLNSGTSTAAALLVQGTLSRDGEVVEQSEAQIDYVPGRATREGGLIFTQDPARYRLELRASGYSAP